MTDKRLGPNAALLLGLNALAWALPAFVGGYAILTMFEFHPLPVPDFVPLRHENDVLRYFLDPWQHWDGQWYLRIADRGYYPGDASPAFLPAYPTAIRLFSVLTLGDRLFAACLVSWASLAVALYVLKRELTLEIGDEASSMALVLLVTFPTAFYFHAAYTESFFLMCAAVSMHAARRGQFAIAGIAALVASLTRWTGFALVPALVVEAWLQALPASTGATPPATLETLTAPESVGALRKISVRAAAWSLLPLAALPIVNRFLESTVGDPWAFSRAQRLWERRLTPPWTGLIDGIRVVLPGHPPYLKPLPGGFPRLADYPGGFLTAHAYNLVAALIGIALAVVAARRLRASHGALAVACVVLPLMTPSRLQPLQSMPRFLVVIFPLFAALALLLRGRPILTTMVVAAFACIQGFFAARFALWFWVA